MINVSLAGDYLHGKLMFTWLSLVVYDGVFCAVLSPQYVIDEIRDLIGSVSECVPTFSCYLSTFVFIRVSRSM